MAVARLVERFTGLPPGETLDQFVDSRLERSMSPKDATVFGDETQKTKIKMGPYFRVLLSGIILLP